MRHVEEQQAQVAGRRQQVARGGQAEACERVEAERQCADGQEVCAWQVVAVRQAAGATRHL